MPMTKLLFSILKASPKCNENDKFNFRDWLLYLRKLQETIPSFTSLSSIQVQPMAGKDGNQSVAEAIQTIIDFSKTFDVES